MEERVTDFGPLMAEHGGNLGVCLDVDTEEALKAFQGD